MSDNKRECEKDNGQLGNPAKKPKIELENSNKCTEINAKSDEDNEVKIKNVVNNGEHKISDEPGNEKGTNGVAENDHEYENGKGEENKVEEPSAEAKEKEIGVNHKRPTGEMTGEFLFSGCCNWDLVGRRKLPKDGKNIGPNLWGPHRIDSMKGVPIRFVASGPTAAHCVIINDKGEAFTWGRNECGQLGHGDVKRREIPLKLECLDGINVVSASCGKGHTILLSDTGRVFTMGDNKCGQLGLGNQTPMIPSPTQIPSTGPPFCRIAAGGDFSMLVDIKGNLFSFGSPEYGQLGHNTDGKYFVTSSKQAFNYDISPRKVSVYIEKTRDNRVNMIPDVEVKEVFCGQNHAIILDQKRRLFTCGFGGYGRLGHNEPKDEMIPRLLKSLDGRQIVSAACGTAYCLALSDQGMLYFWGLAKSGGEATMYPKLVQDLTGWKVRSLGAGHRSIVIAADDSIVSWGPSPTYGELALGDNKRSSPNPTEAKTLNNVYIHKVACGLGHTLMIARNDTEEEREQLEKLPVFKAQ